MSVCRAIERGARVCALLVGVCGALALALLLSGHERALALGLPGSPLMKLGSALGFTFAGLAVAGMGLRSRARRLARAAAAALALLALLSLAIGLGWPGQSLAARAAPASLALTFVLVSVAALRFDPAAGRGLRSAVVACVTASALSAGVLAFYAAWWWHAGERLLLVTLAPQSAVLQALLALAVSALCLAATPPGFFRRHAALLSVAGTMTAALVGAWGLVMATTSASMSREVAQRTQSVVQTLVEHLHRSLDPADLILRQVALRIRDVGVERFARSRLEWAELAATAAALEQVDAILVLDREGRVASFSGRFPAVLPGNYAYRDYFLAHRRGETVYLGPLIRTAMGGPAFTYSRRIEDRDGAFAGVVVATLAPAYFRAFYRALDLGPDGAVGLFRTDQRTLVREPMPEPLEMVDMSRYALFSKHVPARDNGTFVGLSPFDQGERFIAYRVSGSLPVVVTASVGAAPLAAEFAGEFFASAMLLTLAVVVLANGTAQQLRAVARDHAQQRALQEREQHIREIAATVPGMLYQWYARRDGGSGFYYLSPRVQELFGQGPQAYERDWTAMVDARDRPEVRESVARAVAAQAPWQHEYRIAHASGQVRWVRAMSRPVRCTAREIVYTGFVIDVTEERRAQEALSDNERRYQTLIEGSLQGILVQKVHDGFKALFANEVAARMFGYANAAQLLEQPDLRHLLPEGVQAELRQGWQQLCEGTVESVHQRFAALRRDGTPFWMEMLGRRIDWRGDAALQLTIMDVTEQQRLEAELKRQASIDSLTSLLTRRQFNLQAEQELRRCRRSLQPLTALMIDIDHFKRVNDTHGHQGGDAVLVRVAEIVRGVLRGSDLAARFGGEEFVALLVGSDEAEAVGVAQRLREALHRESVPHKGREIRVTASFGISAWQPHEDSLEPALGRADEALYAAKAAGRDRVLVYGAAQAGAATAASPL
ncbi:diguanylate cyclase [Azohydromonas caseinilytica]|uniref:diguanylate cyclase n=1 Tax=Azohydromonas caseinilytica TaxID=2728836 RepID=A0A848F896_9BURK|nr:diguanylate cyclase [Azohydromonas caseinilytica]NML15784.1 diguanylate cyclase [Azohydromonas caseinilytica]